MTKRDRAILYGLALALVGVGLFQIIQKIQYGHVTDCQAAIVSQFVAASGPRANAIDAKDKAEADMAAAILDKNAPKEEKLKKFQTWVAAVENLVEVKTKHPLPPTPTVVCGEA